MLNLLEKSIKEGYGAALQIDATNLDALMGLGEVCLTAAKHSLRSGEEERAKESSLKSLQWYTKAVNLLEGCEFPYCNELCLSCFTIYFLQFAIICFTSPNRNIRELRLHVSPSFL